MLIGKIDLERSRNRVDFGKGFYITDKLGTAHDWAIRKAELEGGGIPTVIAYEVSSDVYSLSGLRFPNVPEIEWLEFICSNRRMRPPVFVTNEPRHGFDWIAGPIADDKVVDVVAEYMRQEITADAAIVRLRALPHTYQLSLHTQATLAYVDDVNVLYKQLKKGRWTQSWIKRKI
ncbi:MAG: DUF3990 domain-containing protein [Oscillospiraceae bacterium]|nr:DUF3990 domain-containing protein [Oscillospiraceae bacterium]